MVYGVAFSPAGTLLATGSEDRTMRLWDLTDPAAPVLGPPRTDHDGPVTTAQFLPHGPVAFWPREASTAP